MLILQKETKQALYEQIYDQLKDQILTGKLQESSMLPSTRTMAKMLDVSRNTVESAYHQLCSEGYLSSKACSGYRVEKIETNLIFPEHDGPNGARIEPKLGINDQRWETEKTAKIAFQYGRLEFADFPIRTYRRIINQILLSPEICSISAYNNRVGELELRQEITKYLFDSRGVRCTPEQVILCSGMPACISLICQLLMKHTTLIALEDPCYDTVRHTFQNHGFGVIPIDVVKDGIDGEALALSGAKAVYVTPSHQFPTGIVMPVNRRLGLIEWADQNDAFIIEDDYDSELRYNSRPIPSLQSMDRRGRVIYTNTFSKSFAPGMRISFMVLPVTLMEQYRTAFRRYNCSVPWLEQKMMSTFMKEGHWSRHLRKISVMNKKRHDALISAIQSVMGDRVRIHGKNGGLHIILEVMNGMQEAELIHKALEAGVKVYPVSGYYSDSSRSKDNQVLIGYSSLSEDEINAGIRILNEAWFS